MSTAPALPRALPVVTVRTHKHIERKWCAHIQHAILAQELLTTFEGEIARVSIMPSMGRKDYPRGGVFDIR
jgi:predicted Rdx family selenoprotein